MLILETRFSEAGTAEWLEIGKMEVGSSNRSGRLCKLYGTAYNKSGRRCKPSDEINVICLMPSYWGRRRQKQDRKLRPAMLALDGPSRPGVPEAALVHGRSW